MTLAAAAGFLASVSWADESRRAGRDVRVTRVYKRALSDIQFCTVPAGEETGQCEGSPPEVGAKAVLFDIDGAPIDVIQIDAVQDVQESCTRVVKFTYTGLEDSFASYDSRSSVRYVVAGIDTRQWLNMHVTMLHDDSDKLPGIDASDPFMAVDLDGDDEPELVISISICTDVEPPPTSLGVGPLGIMSQCLDYWHEGPHGWQSVGRDVSYHCY